MAIPKSKQSFKMAAKAAHKRFRSNFVAKFRLNAAGYVLKSLFMTILDDFDDIQYQTVFQNGR